MEIKAVLNFHFIQACYRKGVLGFDKVFPGSSNEENQTWLDRKEARRAKNSLFHGQLLYSGDANGCWLPVEIETGRTRRKPGYLLIMLCY
ncbi:MAG: hypothetical protein AAB443_02695 [Patescibacteria group bacterium]